MRSAFAVGMMLLLATAAGAQTLDDMSLGTIYAGTTLFGEDTSDGTDDLNGTGEGIGGGGSSGWWGPDDVWTLDWAGGDLIIDIYFTHEDGDLDLILRDDPTAEAAELIYSLTVDDDEQVDMGATASGTYYVIIDGWGGASNTYDLAISPEPTSLLLLGLGGLALLRRR